MLGKEKFSDVSEAIECYLSDFIDVLLDKEYESILNYLIERNEYVYKEMPVEEIFYEVEAFVSGFLFAKSYIRRTTKLLNLKK